MLVIAFVIDKRKIFAHKHTYKYYTLLTLKKKAWSLPYLSKGKVKY